jgi:2-methylcitrate dehydratase PrpD
MRETLTERIADFVAGLTYEDLPAEVAAVGKDLVLDTLGTALAATALGTGCREVIATATALGGPSESTILGSDTKVGAPAAALANGALAHALNYDAAGGASGHPGVTCLAAPLALAEARAPVDGRRFLTAVVVAAELTARITRAVRRDDAIPAILPGQFFGYVAAAAGGAHILGLDAAGVRSALGLALMQSAGSREVIRTGDPPAKAVYGAFPNHGGVLAALLAAGGLVADVDALGGDAGLYAIVSDGRFETTSVAGGLGSAYACREVEFKPWPVSAHVAPFVEAALTLAADDASDADAIASVELRGSSVIRAWFEPLDARRRPENAAAAANSAIFAVAAALAYGDLSLAAFTAGGLTDAATLRLADRTTYVADDGVRGGTVTVRTANGKRFTAHIDEPLGAASRPLSRDRLDAKFRDCCARAGLDAAAADAAAAFIARLETVDDVSALPTFVRK